MDPFDRSPKHRAGSALQWFGDVTKSWAQLENVPAKDSDGIATFVTDETVMLMMQDWAEEQLAAFSCSRLPNKMGLLDALGKGRTKRHHHPQQAQMVLDHHGCIKAHYMREMPWTFHQVRHSRHLRLKLERVLLRAMRLYWKTYTSQDPAVSDLCPTTGDNAFGDWPVYSPTATFPYRMLSRQMEAEARARNLVEAMSCMGIL